MNYNYDFSPLPLCAITTSDAPPKKQENLVKNSKTNKLPFQILELEPGVV
jgi:hypothetical protein